MTLKQLGFAFTTALALALPLYANAQDAVANQPAQTPAAQTPTVQPPTVQPPAAQPPAAQQPVRLPPEKSGPLVRFVEIQFHPVNESIIEPQTYLYYIQTRPSRSLDGVWVNYDDDAERVLRDDFKRLWDTKFL